ncbi:hypothetical protein J3L16_01750 [Alteromonas sp. 5E99-2]|uniref:hypothetical protein n=1 Tax=Alteromonas sp. 5E99-2 TaxID=2817683 RepID=UPI001A9956E8|nr:hypothetical protein [Alteromonas sp. 5E99-2]MBO1254404.1 hypothetical protein [Alteromonas sp. 5E99-2]
MNLFHSSISLSVFVLFSGLSSFSVSADGLDDLKSALSRLNKDVEIRADINYQLSTESVQSGESQYREGVVDFSVHSHENGLDTQVSSQVMQKLNEEAALRNENEDAQTPTLMALNNVDAVDINRYLTAAKEIERTLEQATFVNETTLERDGISLRQLNFTLPLESLIRDKQARKYASKFSSSYQVLIDENGVPVEEHLDYEGSGRAYIVIKVAASGSIDTEFQEYNGRLVRVKDEGIQRTDSTFGEYEFIETLTLNIIE